MRVNMQFNTTSYKRNNPLNIPGRQQNNPVKTADVNNGHISLKRMLSEANKEQKNPFSVTTTNSVFSGAMSYSEKLRAQRENMKNASLEKKKLKYQFKDISSKIISSKTSQAARGAVSAAKRELLRLKKEKASGEYDPEEIEAAIAHAKSMERVARKKVKHLEEEEMAKAAGGPCAEIEIELEEKLEKNSLHEEESEDIEEEELLQLEDDMEKASVEDMEAMLDEMSKMSSEMLEQMDEMSSDMFSELEESMKDMLDEMGFGEMSDSLEAIKGDMDPEDLKMMKIKHRCKEMKEMTKADSDYLKAVFDHLAKLKDGGLGISMGTPANMSVNITPTVQAVTTGVDAGSMQTIDISV